MGRHFDIKSIDLISKEQHLQYFNLQNSFKIIKFGIFVKSLQMHQVMSLRYHRLVWAVLRHQDVASQQPPYLPAPWLWVLRPLILCLMRSSTRGTGSWASTAPLLSALFVGTVTSCDDVIITLPKSSTSSTHHLQTVDDLATDHATARRTPLPGFTFYTIFFTQRNLSSISVQFSLFFFYKVLKLWN